MSKSRRIGSMKLNRKSKKKADWEKPVHERMREGACRRPDRDEPRMVCGYPLPCPHHSMVIDMTEEPTVIAKANHADPSQKTIRRLREIAKALGGGVQEV